MSDLQERLSELNRKKHMVEKAIEFEKALNWLRLYGPKEPQKTKENIGAEVSMNYASGCDGVKEASALLEDVIGEMFPEIVVKAIARAEKLIGEA